MKRFLFAAMLCGFANYAFAVDTDGDGLFDLIDVSGFNRNAVLPNFFDRAIEDLDGANLLTNATWLGLDRNRITGIDRGDFHNLSNLRGLRLGDNQITHIEREGFEGLGNLDFLKLSGNQLTSIDSGAFEGLTNLRELELIDNQLTSIERNDFDGLSNLGVLWLNSNQLSDFDSDDFGRLASLKQLFLNYNRIASIERGDFSGLTGLVSLGLGGNQISSIESGDFDGLTSLQSLGLNGNLLFGIESGDFDGLSNLFELGLNDNLVTSIESGAFDGLDGLSHLYLHNNPISRIDAGAFQGLSLVTLYMRELPDLRELNLSGSTFKDLSPCWETMGGVFGICLDCERITTLVLDDATLNLSSFNAIVGETSSIATASLVGLHFSDAKPNDLSSLLAIPTLNHVRVDRALYDHYVDEFDAFAAIPGNTVTVVPEPTGTIILLGILGTVATCCRRRRNAYSYLRATRVACLLLFAITNGGRADIYRTDNGQLIPGTEGITPGPGVDLSYLNLEFADLGHKNLTNANFTGANLNNATFGSSNLKNADLTAAVVTRAYFASAIALTKEQIYSTASYKAKNLQAIQLYGADLSDWNLSGQNLTGAGLGGVNLTNADLRGANLANANLIHATLAGAVFAGTNVARANFAHTTQHGFTKEQLYSTASYQAKNLSGIYFGVTGFSDEDSRNDLTGWDLSGQDLTNAYFGKAKLTNANLSRAIVTGANFSGADGFLKEQLYTTVNYLAMDLRKIGLEGIDLTGANFSGQDLRDADFYDATLTNVDLSGAVVTGANFGSANGFFKEQLYTTVNYLAMDLRRIGFWGIDLTGADFSGQDLRGAGFFNAKLTNVDLSGAIVTGANFSFAGGLLKEQLYETASYQAKDLRTIGLGGIDLTGADFSGFNLSGTDFRGADLTHAKLNGALLTNAVFSGAMLSNANLSAANLTNALLNSANLTGADFSEAIITGAMFSDTTPFGLTREQLYSTASYHAQHLQGIALDDNELAGWDFEGQDLTGASFRSSNLFGANLFGADLRGALVDDIAQAIVWNTILPDGRIPILGLFPGQAMLIRDDDGEHGPIECFWGCHPRERQSIPVTIEGHFAMDEGSVLQLLFDADPWDSLISFEPGIFVAPGGALELTFADDVDVATQVGRTLRIFDWTGVSPTGQFVVQSPYVWDLSNLYITGEVTLAAIPEPTILALLLFAVTGWFVGKIRRVRR